MINTNKIFIKFTFLYILNLNISFSQKNKDQNHQLLNDSSLLVNGIACEQKILIFYDLPSKKQSYKEKLLEKIKKLLSKDNDVYNKLRD
jgi:hypothetical protein